MQTDEVLRLDQRKCIALFQGHKPALLYKMSPEELPDFAGLKSCRVIDYVPEWKKRENTQSMRPCAASVVHVQEPVSVEKCPLPTEQKKMQQDARTAEVPVYDLPDLRSVDFSGLGMVERPISTVRGEDGETSDD